MATGDVVSAIGASNAILDFQPAAGVEVCITYVNTAGQLPNLYNGTNVTNSDTSTTYPFDAYNIKMFVNNTNYLRIAAAVAKISGYCGVQTK